MKNYVLAIRKAIDAENWYAALFISLALPDICGSIEYPKKSSSQRYEEWFKKYLGTKYGTTFTADECWLLRCSCFHSGRDDNEKAPNDGIVFLAPLKGALFHLHRLRAEKGWVREVIALQVDIFCEDICLSVEKWLDDVKDDVVISKKLKMLLRIQKMKKDGNRLTVPIPIRIEKY
jgi:hypothetical protein